MLANSADPDEMQHCAAFHLGLHCFPEHKGLRRHFLEMKVKILIKLSPFTLLHPLI